MGFGVVFRVLAISAMQSGVMHGKTIARSHSVLMHACMRGDCSQLSIECPTDTRAGRARLEGSRQTGACLEHGFGFLGRFCV